MLTGHTSWEPIDIRDGRRVGICTYPTEQSVMDAIKGWKARDARGGRRDLHGLIPYLSHREVPRDEAPC